MNLGQKDDEALTNSLKTCFTELEIRFKVCGESSNYIYGEDGVAQLFIFLKHFLDSLVVCHSGLKVSSGPLINRDQSNEDAFGK